MPTENTQSVCDCNMCRVNRGAHPFYDGNHDVCTKPAPSPTPSVSTTTQEQPIICGNCGPTAFKITYDGTLGLILKCVTCGEQKLIELPVAAAPSVAGTQPTPDKMQQEMAGLRFRIHNLERHNQYFFRCESAWCHPADKQFQNPALETFKEALAISAGAAQGTPQVEEIVREIMQLVVFKPSAIRSILAKHGVGAPAQPGPQTRFDDFDEAAHPFNIWWKEHGHLMMSGGGRREFIWACRGWIAREQLAEGVEVTGDSMHESKPVPTQGTPEPPKVEEAADQMFDLVAERFDSGGKLKRSEIEEALRPYFPPASQTPKIQTAKNELLERFASVFDSVSMPEMAAEIRSEIVATPASTARTDGWVSVEERLPEFDVPVLIWRFGFIVRERIEYAVVAKLVRNIEEDGADKYWEDWSGDDISCGNVTHWRELPAAPGSVPQAPDPLKDDSRCAVCCWPLAESAEKGCVRGNCSMRPFPEVFYDLERANREYGNKFGVPARAAQPGDAPQKEKP